MTDTGKKYKYRVGITNNDIKNATQGNTEGPPRITDSTISWRKSESAEDSFQSWIRNRGTATFAEIIPSLIAGKSAKRRSWTFYKATWAGISIYEDRLCYDEEPYVLTLDDLVADDWEVVE